MDLLMPPAIHGEQVAGQSADLRKRISILAQDLQRNMFDIGELALEAQERGYLREWGDDTEGELGIKLRKLQYLSRICRVCRDCGVKREDYQVAGVTKLRFITSLDPNASYFNQETKQHENLTEHIVTLIAEAPELSTKEVEERVAHLKGMDGENSMVTKSYSVTKSCYENTVKRCFEVIRRHLGSAGRDGMGQAVEFSDGRVLEVLCAEYLSDPRNFMEEVDCSHDQVEVKEDRNVEINSGLRTIPSEQSRKSEE